MPALQIAQRMKWHGNQQIDARGVYALFQASGQGAPQWQTQVPAAAVLERQDPRSQSVVPVIVPQADELRPS